MTACGSPLALLRSSTAHQPHLHNGALPTTGAVICSLYSQLSSIGVEKLLQNLFVTLKLYSQVLLHMAPSVLHGQETCTAMGYVSEGGLEFHWSSSAATCSLSVENLCLYLYLK